MTHPARAEWSTRWWAWGLGLLVGLVVVGPGLGPGSLLNLDLQVTPSIPVPNGIYGLGPALTQRVPLFALLGMGSAVVGGPVAAKVFIVALVAVAFVGSGRLVGSTGGPVAAITAGLLGAAGPFALTRLGAGHLNLLWALAVLPWVLPRLCRPSSSLARTFLAVLALAVGGPGSGTLALTAVVVATILESRGRRRTAGVAAASGLASLVWLAPTAVVLWAGAAVSPSGDFATEVDGVAGWASVLAGGGFWNGLQQVGAVGWGGAAAGAVLTGLAVAGRRDLPGTWARTATALACVGLALALASAVPGVRGAYQWASLLPVGAPLRESQRFLALWMVWLAPAAALGGRRIGLSLGARATGPDGSRPAWVDGAGAALALVPLVVAALVSVPSWWGIGGRLEPVAFPRGWGEARAAVRAQPGTVVALPWNEYPTLRFAGSRTVFNPVPDYLGGDVISSYDPLFDPDGGGQEQVDRRSVVVDGLVDDLADGTPVSAALADLGVRWVFASRESDDPSIASLADDPGLRVVVDDPSVVLYEVTAWPGPVVARDGTRRAAHRPWPPVIRTDAPAGSVVSVAGAPGWIQGWTHPAEVTADGRLRTTASGTVWFWPAGLLVLVDLGVAAGALWCVTRIRRRP